MTALSCRHESAHADRNSTSDAKGRTRAAVLEACDKLAKELRAARYVDLPIEVEVDRRDLGGGVKNWEWIKKACRSRRNWPAGHRIGNAMVSRRDRPVKAKS